MGLDWLRSSGSRRASRGREVAVALMVGLVMSWPGPGAAARTTRGELRRAYTIIGYSPSDRFSEPHGIAVDARNGILYVADTEKGRVVGFSLQGLPKFTLQVEGITAPYDLAMDGEGRLFISDRDTALLRAVDAQGKTVVRIDLASAGVSPRVRGLAVDRRGRVYVGDQGAGQVVVCDTEGHVLSRLGGPGENPGQVKMIEDVALDRVGRVYVVDSVGTAVNVFDPSGKFIFRFGRVSAEEDGLLQPVSVSVDEHDQLWLVDRDGHSLQVFDGRGFLLRRFGAETPGGLSPFLYPVSTARDNFGNVYVVEQMSGDVQVLTLETPFLPFGT